MSLLSGIRFTRKDDRNDAEEKKKDKKSSKKSKDKKKKTEKQKIYKSISDDDDDDDNVDMNALATEEMVKTSKISDKLPLKRMDWMRDSDDIDRNNAPVNGFSCNENRYYKMQKSDKPDQNKFSSLLAKLNDNKEYINHDKNDSENEDIHSNHSNEFPTKSSYSKFPPNHIDDTSQLQFNQISSTHDIITLSTHIPNTNNNLSIAAQLRAKLKQNIKVGISSKDEIISKNAASTSESETSSSQMSSTPLVYGSYQDMAVRIAKDSKNESNSFQSVSSTSTKNIPNKLSSRSNKDISNSSKHQHQHQQQSLKELVAFERFGGEDMDDTYRDNILRLGENYKGTELGRSGIFGGGDQTGIDEEEADIDMSLFERKDDKLSYIQLEQKQMNKAKNENKFYQKTISNCVHCLESVGYSNLKHLIISTGSHTQLRLKSGV
eukprot:gene5589-11272_t